MRQGFIIPTPGNVIDYDYVLHQIDQDAQKFELRQLAFDRWGATKLVNDLAGMGFEIVASERGDKKSRNSTNRQLVQFGARLRFDEFAHQRTNEPDFVQAAGARQ